MTKILKVSKNSWQLPEEKIIRYTVRASRKRASRIDQVMLNIQHAAYFYLDFRQTFYNNFLMSIDSDSEYRFRQESQEENQGYLRVKKQMAYQKSINSGPWNQDEDLKYIFFIDKNRSLLASRSKRRIGKIFKQMSKFLVTRNAIQCRSHHQKQLQKYYNISKVILAFKSEFGQEKYRRRFDELGSSQLNLHMSQSSSDQQKQQKKQKTSESVEIQTDIAGIHIQLIPESQVPTSQPFLGPHQNFANPFYPNIMPLGQYPYNPFLNLFNNPQGSSQNFSKR